MHTSNRVARAIFFLVTAISLSLAARAADARVYIQYHDNQKGAVQSELARLSARTFYEFDDLNTFVVALPQAARDALQRNPAVAWIDDDPRRGFLAQTTPYGINMVQAPLAVAAGASGDGIKIGVVDSGVLSTHDDLPGARITGEPDFGVNDERSWYRDMLSHGTHVVGTLAAVDNSVGVLGVAPLVRIHMVKVFGDTGNWIYSSDLLNACRIASLRGCRVISMSLGGSVASRTEKAGLDDLYNNRGILLVAAAGNDGTTGFSYPASYDSVISVAAVDYLKAIASFSQQNSQVELAAPGVAVRSTVSYLDNASVAAGSSNYDANRLDGAPNGVVTASLVYGDFGTSTNQAWSGKIVLVDRGTNTFAEKLQNVQASGGLGCIIANNVDGNFQGTVGTTTVTIPAVTVSKADGATLQAAAGSSVTLTSVFTQPANNGYDEFDGTSMSTPHVSGAAALIWSKYPGATNAQIRAALDNSAYDLGASGRDPVYGFGLVQASAALDKLATMALGTDGTPPSITNAGAAPSTNSKNGTFDVTWITNEPATSDVQIAGSLYLNSTKTKSHKMSFRGSRGATYTFTVFSTDANGNTSSEGPLSITLP